MKKSFFTLLLFAGLFTSCTTNDDDEVTTPTPQTGEITGEITSDKTYATGNYTLKGIVKVKPGATLTFEAGSTITCDIATGDNALVVLNGGKLIINGTASQPVVFTEKNKISGNWGGIIMYGDAPITAASGATTALSEDGNVQTYGGTNTAHNGGSLHYVRVEYAGKKLGDGQKENNAFTFYSCGSGTVLDHLVAYKGADDGFEFFGGTVSATNLVSFGNFDDAFDWQDGWRGQNNENWYAYQTGKGNFGMEIEASNNNNAFGPKISKITLKRATGTTPESDTDIQLDAFQFKKEGNGEYDNIIIDGYGDYTVGATTYHGAAVKIQDNNTNVNQVNGGKLKLTNVKIINTSVTTPIGATDAISVLFSSTNFTTNNNASGASGTSMNNGNWSNVDGTNLVQ